MKKLSLLLTLLFVSPIIASEGHYREKTRAEKIAAQAKYICLSAISGAFVGTAFGCLGCFTNFFRPNPRVSNGQILFGSAGFGALTGAAVACSILAIHETNDCNPDGRVWVEGKTKNGLQKN